MESRATTQLAGEHQIILQALEILGEMAASMEKGESVDRSDLQLLMGFFRDFAHGSHGCKERSILTPALQDLLTTNAFFEGPDASASRFRIRAAYLSVLAIHVTAMAAPDLH